MTTFIQGYDTFRTLNLFYWIDEANDHPEPEKGSMSIDEENTSLALSAISLSVDGNNNIATFNVASVNEGQY